MSFDETTLSEYIIIFIFVSIYVLSNVEKFGTTLKILFFSIAV